MKETWKEQQNKLKGNRRGLKFMKYIRKIIGGINKTIGSS